MSKYNRIPSIAVSLIMICVISIAAGAVAAILSIKNEKHAQEIQNHPDKPITYEDLKKEAMTIKETMKEPYQTPVLPPETEKHWKIMLVTHEKIYQWKSYKEPVKHSNSDSWDFKDETGRQWYVSGGPVIIEGPAP